MGASGPGIFSDDTASDVRSDYRVLLEDGLSDREALDRVLSDYADIDDDEQHIVWLALAATQSRLGRLDDEVKARALAVIDSGEGLDVWEEAGGKALASRKAALQKLRAELVAVQPKRKAVRRPWRDVTDLQAGDVLAFETNPGRMVLLRVARVDDDRLGAAPILELLDWQGDELPDTVALRDLRALTRLAPGSLGGSPRPETFLVSRHRKKDPTYADVGFRVVARVNPVPQDAAVQAWTLTHWAQMADILHREVG